MIGIAIRSKRSSNLFNNGFPVLSIRIVKTLPLAGGELDPAQYLNDKEGAIMSLLSSSRGNGKGPLVNGGNRLIEIHQVDTIFQKTTRYHSRDAYPWINLGELASAPFLHACQRTWTDGLGHPRKFLAGA